MTPEIDLQPEQIHRWAYVYAYAHMYTQGNKKNLLFLRIVEKLLKTRESPYLHWLKPNVLPLPGYLKLGRNATPGMTLHYSHAHTCLPKHSHNKRLQLKLKHKPWTVTLPISTSPLPRQGSKSSTHLHRGLFNLNFYQMRRLSPSPTAWVYTAIMPLTGQCPMDTGPNILEQAAAALTYGEISTGNLPHFQAHWRSNSSE